LPPLTEIVDSTTETSRYMCFPTQYKTDPYQIVKTKVAKQYLQIGHYI
jgi:hypothetical protein